MGKLSFFELQNRHNKGAANYIYQLLERHKDGVDRFLQIAYRKVATPDEYGYENQDALDGEIERFVIRLAALDGNLGGALAREAQGQREDGKECDGTEDADSTAEDANSTDDLEGIPILTWRSQLLSILRNQLQRTFRAYYAERQATKCSESDVAGMNGADFEAHVAKLLRSAGVSAVATTPCTGDQGADLLFSKDGKKFVAQAKRYTGAVGNSAVQEAYAAKGFYKCDVAWVVTNSIFTSSARLLAKELGVVLCDGSELLDFGNFADRYL